MMPSMRKLHTVLFIGVMFVVQSMALVCPYSDPRCECIETSQFCTNLQQIPPINTGVNVSQIDDLSFENGNIASITNSSLPAGLTSIFLFRNPITHISDDAFDKSAETLKNVYITEAKFKNLPVALKKLSKLMDLHLEDTPIQEWDAATLKQIAATLEYLTLINMSLSAWPSWISDFHFLGSVDLSKNSLTSIPDDAFSFIEDSLTSLDLSYTNLTQVPQALSRLTSLTSLNLRNNKFTDVNDIEKIIRSPYAQKLSYLYLDSVGMTRIINFSNLTSLRSLRLSSNGISDVPAGSLPTSLTTLDLSDNKLTSVPEDVAGMSRLSRLILSTNLITDIESNSFPSSLTYLNLDSNNLAIITNTTLRNLNLLRTLNVNYNPISTISPEAFSDLVSLRVVLIAVSGLTEIPLAFTSLSSQVDIAWITTEPVACPCPAPQELIQWFSSSGSPSSFIASCGNGQSVDSYLSGQCGQISVTP